MKSEVRVHHTIAQRHGKPIEPETIMERQILCSKCGNDIFKSWSVDNSCACDYDWTYEVCTKCGAIDSGDVLAEKTEDESKRK